ncbi:MFS transporter [Nakamurella alba]|uniref:MFS transporter n=1 Tax=Nakamurella alba TaxID=2665158 RepID=UPI0018ABCAAA|nr:MFS transporter [Nakamurella alba]
MHIGIRTGLGAGFWRLWPASALSDLGYGIGVAATPLLAVSLTDDPIPVTLLSSLLFLPWLLFALPVGALVDRWDRRRTMALANSARALVIAGLTVLIVTDTVGIGLLYVAAALLGTAEVFYDQAARAILPEVVAPDQLDRGNSWLSGAEMVGQLFVGGPIGAALFAWWDASPFAGMAIGFAVSAAVVSTLPRRSTPVPRAGTSLRSEIAEGLRWLRGHALIRGLTAASALTAGLGAMFNALLVLYALQVLRLPEAGFGILLVAGGIGGVAGALAATPLVRLCGRSGALAVGACLSPIGVVVIALVDTTWIACLLMGLGTASITVWNVVFMSLRQAIVPERLFGRVLGVYRTVIWGGIPVGALAGGVLAEFTSVSTALLCSGAGQALVAVRIVQLLRRHREIVDAGVTRPTDP